MQLSALLVLWIEGFFHRYLFMAAFGVYCNAVDFYRDVPERGNCCLAGLYLFLPAW